eukprot:10016742-Ditylum_brightwellii.AAC.1
MENKVIRLIQKWVGRHRKISWPQSTISSLNCYFVTEHLGQCFIYLSRYIRHPGKPGLLHPAPAAYSTKSESGWTITCKTSQKRCLHTLQTARSSKKSSSL